MNRRNRVLLCALLVAVVACSSAAAGLLEYVARPEPAYQWSKANEMAMGPVKVVDLAMTSQVWQGIPWKHTIRIYVPSEISYPQSALLMITGGNPGAEDMMYGPIIAQRTEAPFAILFNIPNQPLFQGLSEDRLIAYTFSKFLETGDDTWPLLLPMTKSAIKAMDALQAFAKQEWQRELTSFVVTGASKRGWTTWLTGAADQQRVKGIAPMVIDTLNMPAQMPHQLEMFGSYSAEISEYSERSLQAAMSSPQGAELTKMVDPYSYRERITMPKLIINGANDPYWATDALNLYWEGLVGPKWVLYVPNAGHGLEDRGRVLNALGAFSEAVAAGKSLPDMSWQYADAGDNLTLTITANPQPAAARVWVVHSPDMDFRNDHWEATPMQQQGSPAAGGQAFVGAIAKPTADNVALFGEAEFNVGGHTLTLSTQVRVVAHK